MGDLRLPFVFEDRDTVARLLDGEVGETLRQSMREAADLEVLAFGEIGFRQITNDVRPIVVPADLEDCGSAFPEAGCAR